MFANRMLRKIFRYKKEKVTDGENCIIRSFTLCTLPNIRVIT